MNQKDMRSRKIILYIATTLDGYIARENGNLDWLPGASGEIEDGTDEEDCGYKEFLNTVDTVIMGNNTYKQILSFGGDYPYRDKANFVFTREPRPSDDHVEYVNEDIESFVSRLKGLPGKNIWLIGGADLFAHFFEKNLVDELMLFIVPTTLGKGISLFPQIPNTHTLKLIDSCTYTSGAANGIVKLHYLTPEN